MKKSLLSLLALIGIAGSAMAAGTAENPMSVSDVIAAGVPASPEADSYVQGYIVGWVDGAVLKSGANFTLPAGSATNLLLADSSTENEVSHCIPIQLPTGDIRNALNLQDHPSNLGHQVLLCGSLEKYFGAPGLKSVTKYQWIGDAPSTDKPEYGPEITGTAENPLTIDQFKAAATAGTSIPNTYLKGFIVGYVPDKVLDDAVVNDVTGDNVSVSNILLAASTAPTSLDECVPVQLPTGAVRSALNLKDNPSNLGKAVTLLGTHTNYFGVTGLKEVSAYAFGDEEIVPPAPEADAFFTGLVDNCDGWVFDNVELPEGITYVWKWNEGSYGKYLNGSAHNKKAFAAESYAVSPVIDLTGQTEAKCSFDHAAKFQTTLRDLCGFAVREEGATTWTALTIPTWPDAGAWTFVNSGDIDLSAYDGKKIQVAFKYKSSADGADTWEIKNFKVNVKQSSGVAEIANDLKVYAANGTIYAPAGARVYNLNGVATGRENLAKGMYIVVVDRKAVKIVVR